MLRFYENSNRKKKIQIRYFSLPKLFGVLNLISSTGICRSKRKMNDIHNQNKFKKPVVYFEQIFYHNSFSKFYNIN